MNRPCHTIKVAAKLTGLTTHVIRIWEKRYGAVVPSRTDSKRRLFTDADLQRLSLLRQATDVGHSIGSIANMENEGLRKLLHQMETSAPFQPAVVKGNGGGHPVREDQAALIELIRNFNHQGLEAALMRCNMGFGTQGLLLKMVGPLAQQIGELWAKGELNAAHEHFASAVIREFLLKTTKPYGGTGEGGPVLVVATPNGQLHELGAVMVVHAATNLGWKVIYLGASLPAADLAGAAMQNHARAVALSIIYPDDDPQLTEELLSLRKYLSPEIKILVGGRAANNYLAPLRRIGAELIEDLPSLFQTLGTMRANRG